ncbi:MAG: hypothetical protein QM214_01225 [Bacillota bacterium]|jgi:hypothetical protein|nr:hypothetical protein [Bacillota bacterium]HHU43971.1 hypothetical protein [Clostridiales bacterium]
MKKPVRTPYAKLAFYTFIIAAMVYLIQAILSFFGIGSSIMLSVQSIVIVILFVLAGIIGWQHCKGKAFIYKLLYFISALIIIVAVVLPAI